MSTKSLMALACTSLLLIGMSVIASHAESLGLSDSALEGITAQGISTGGDLSTSCSTTSSSLCVGTYEWNDNHQFDASTNKGAIVMDGYVQQNVMAQINTNSTQSATANGVNVIGDVSLSNSTINMTNTNNATSFLGGF